MWYKAPSISWKFRQDWFGHLGGEGTRTSTHLAIPKAYRLWSKNIEQRWNSKFPLCSPDRGRRSWRGPVSCSCRLQGPFGLPWRGPNSHRPRAECGCAARPGRGTGGRSAVHFNSILSSLISRDRPKPISAEIFCRIPNRIFCRNWIVAHFHCRNMLFCILLFCNLQNNWHSAEYSYSADCKHLSFGRSLLISFADPMIKPRPNH